MQAVAVLGDGAGLAEAAGLAGVDPDGAARAADQLVALDILRPADGLEFAHPIIREAVYAEMGPRGPAAAFAWLARALAEPPPAEARGEVLLELGIAGLRSGRRKAVDHLTVAVELIEEPDLYDVLLTERGLGPALQGLAGRSAGFPDSRRSTARAIVAGPMPRTRSASRGSVATPDRKAVEARSQVVEEPQRLRVGPVEIVDAQGHGALVGQVVQQPIEAVQHRERPARAPARPRSAQRPPPRAPARAR